MFHEDRMLGEGPPRESGTKDPRGFDMRPDGGIRWQMLLTGFFLLGCSASQSSDAHPKSTSTTPIDTVPAVVPQPQVTPKKAAHPLGARKVSGTCVLHRGITREMQPYFGFPVRVSRHRLWFRVVSFIRESPLGS